MNYELKKPAFSLTEVLLAVGTLAIGMLLVAGVFPVSIRFTTIATERTIAAVVADEAFAKIKLYAEGNPNDPNDDIDPTDPNVMVLYQLKLFNDVYADWWASYAGVPRVTLPVAFLPHHEFSYPSDGTVNIFGKQYFWSALCRRVVPADQFYIDPNMLYGINSSSRLVQVTIFVSRRISANLRYPAPDPNITPQVLWPMPVQVGVSQGSALNELLVDTNKAWFINDGCTIVANETGRIHRVMERYAQPDNMILLDDDWQGGLLPGSVWVIPPPVGGGRYPCIGVYQKIIRF